jgi:class 3 adenylate cyclase
MAARTWRQDAAETRIKARFEEVATVEVKEYVRDTDLSNLGRNCAYRVDGVHIYVEILNLEEMLGVTDFEGPTCHRRTLRFLNLHYRAVHRILSRVGAIHVDFHNQRLHAVVVKPYGDEPERIHKAVAIAKLIADVLQNTGEESEDPIPAAEIRVGIDSGVALAVNNGRRGHREPLFLGPPANLAAKLASGREVEGIYLTNTARETAGFATVTDDALTALTPLQVWDSEEVASLDVTCDEIIKAWEKDLADQPIGAVGFAAHTPPYGSLDLELLTPANSRRQDAVSIYADIDGFTNYVARHITNDYSAKEVVRVLHVLRSEMDAVLHADFAGRKIRFIGDSVHGILVEGTATETETKQTITNAVLCAGAIRSSFNLALKVLTENSKNVDGLGIAIGLEYGSIAVTRLGMKGEMIRCCVSRAVLASENEQLDCNGAQTAIGATAYASASGPVRKLFSEKRRRANLTYTVAVEELSAAQDADAKASKALRSIPQSLLRTAAAAPAVAFPHYATGPTKPAGFA